MNSTKSFDKSTCEDQMRMAERELASFVQAVTELFGPDQARLSAEEWVEEAESMDASPQPTRRDWQSVTVAASFRLAKRVNIASVRRTLGESTDTNAPPIPSSDCFACSPLV
jgi:hypothetical protein